jgi:HSP20 family protein
MEVLKNLGDTVRHGWQDLAENWRELINRGSSALTHFLPRPAEEPRDPGGGFPRWAMVAGEVMDHKDSIIVRLELPGVRREDCKVSVVDGHLRVEGEKRVEHEYSGASYRMMQRAYGSFVRTVALPREAAPETANAELRDGVLKIEFRKQPGAAPQRHNIEVR